MVFLIEHQKVLKVAAQSLFFSTSYRSYGWKGLIGVIASLVLFYFLAYLFNNLYNVSNDSTVVSFNLSYAENVRTQLLLPIPLIKSKRLKKKEKEAMTLTSELKDILTGSLLGDLHGRLRYGKVCFVFKQGIIHQDYLNHLYELFSHYCPSAPRIGTGKPDVRTGKVYSSIVFATYTLPCFIELYNSFYVDGKKIIPLNIEEMLTPLGLAYWIADDGSWNKVSKYLTFCTDSYSLAEVENLIKVRNTKF